MLNTLKDISGNGWVCGAAETNGTKVRMTKNNGKLAVIWERPITKEHRREITQMTKNLKKKKNL